MRFRKPYSLYVRKTKEGIPIYYYRYYKDGVRVCGHSTGCTDRVSADRYVRRLIINGELK